MKKLLLLPVFIILAACSHKAEHIEKAFYYWKNNEYELRGNEDTVVGKLGLQKLYVKFFEVSRDEMVGNIPVAKTQIFQFDHFRPDSLTVIPTVYIDNQVFIKSSKQELDTLAKNVNYLVAKYYLEGVSMSKMKELQIDCDWTPKSKGNYFYFLRQLKKESGVTLSCTLRLYPYKYPDKMGVPPIDKVMLMCYNLLNPLKSETKNSILDTKELAAYLDAKEYPLHMDVALPIFSWMQVYQNKRFKGLVYPEPGIKNILKEVKPLWFEVVKDTFVDTHYIRKGDLVKFEEITPQKVSEAITLIKKHVSLQDTVTVTFFHLDDKQLKNFNNETLSGFYSAFTE
jgi:hypothetical protein